MKEKSKNNEIPQIVTSLGIFTGAVIVVIAIFVYANMSKNTNEVKNNTPEAVISSVDASLAYEFFSTGNNIIVYFTEGSCEQCESNDAQIKKIVESENRSVLSVDLSVKANADFLKSHPDFIADLGNRVSRYNLGKLEATTEDFQDASLVEIFRKPSEVT